MVSIPQTQLRLIKVLLVEDSPADAALVWEFFRDSKRNIEIVRVENGEEALAYLRGKGDFDRGQIPDLVLLDLNLPRKNGFEVLWEIKNNPLLNAIPVVVLSHSHLESDIRRAYEGKANFYLVKPAGLLEFFAEMHKVEDIWLGGINEADD